MGDEQGSWTTGGSYGWLGDRTTLFEPAVRRSMHQRLSATLLHTQLLSLLPWWGCQMSGWGIRHASCLCSYYTIIYIYVYMYMMMINFDLIDRNSVWLFEQLRVQLCAASQQIYNACDCRLSLSEVSVICLIVKTMSKRQHRTRVSLAVALLSGRCSC